MKIVYIENPLQDESTINPQVIDGKILYWKTRSIKTTQTLQEFITTVKECFDDVEYFLIYDIRPCDRYFCDQDCKPGYGCKQKYVEDNHAIMIRYAIIPKEKEPEDNDKMNAFGKQLEFDKKIHRITLNKKADEYN